MSEKSLVLSWDDFHADTRRLAERLQPAGQPAGQWRGLVAITRGGLVPATILACELDIRRIETIGIASYNQDNQQGRLEIIKAIGDGFSLDGEGKGLLVVDDLADSGKTLALVRTMLPKAHFVAVYAKPAGKPLVDECVVDIAQDVWLYFPWDRR